MERSDVLWDLVQTGHLAARCSGEVFAGCGLTPAQYGVLASLADGDDLSQADLARAVPVRPQSMGRLIGAMVDDGLVLRRGSGGRGRRSRIEISAKGSAVLGVARPAAYRLLASEVTGLDHTQRTLLTELLQMVRNQLETLDEVDPSNRVETSAGPTVSDRDATFGPER